MIVIRTFQPGDRDAVISLVLHCQNDGTRPLVSVEDQPELLRIPELYLDRGGHFWVAMDDDALAGCVGLFPAEGSLGILKKFFVYEAYRGAPHHLGQRLYRTLADYARSHGFTALLLDTPKNTDRAHRFYRRAGFRLLPPEEVPLRYDHPYAESDFFYLPLSTDTQA